MKREELTRYLDELLESGSFKDYCPNGLQVEGRAEVQRIVLLPVRHWSMRRLHPRLTPFSCIMAGSGGAKMAA